MIRLRENDVAALLGFFRGGPRAVFDQLPPDVREAVEIMEDQRTNRNRVRELIDDIAEILQSRRAGAILSGETLAMLRTAILRPSEAVRFRALSRERLNCENCTRPLTAGDICTVAARGDGTASVYCPNCHPLTTVNCPKCHNHLPLPNTIARVIGKLWKECPHCANGERPQPVDHGLLEERRDRRGGRVGIVDPAPQTIGRQRATQRGVVMPEPPRWRELVADEAAPFDDQPATGGVFATTTTENTGWIEPDPQTAVEGELLRRLRETAAGIGQDINRGNR